MDQRVSLITLAVTDVSRATTFYEGLGWTRVDSPDGIVVFDLLGQTLGLYPRADLARPVDDRLFFAGEATHPTFFTAAHGAWLSGERAAAEALAALQGRQG